MRAVAAAGVAALALAAGASSAYAQAGVSYEIPPDNPFLNTPNAAPEVYAYGFRNPWRFSFDRLTGDLIIGDVGGSTREELDWVGARAAAGRNFGWSCREGTAQGPNPGRCPPGTSFVEPLFDYPWFGGAVITAGFVVRDPALQGLMGRALYADFGGGEIRSVNLAFGSPDDRPTGASVASLGSFGEDAAGRLYAVNLFGNAVFRLVAGSSPGTIGLQPIGGSWDGPIAIGSYPGDADRLFVAEREGRVRLVQGSAVSGVYLDIDADVAPASGERGLLSVAAAPDFPTSGRIYVYYTDNDGDIVIDEFTNGDIATRRPLLRIEHSANGNHNGGQLQFGPDGCLWITTGDGGSQGDPPNNAQTLASHLGKLLRIDPDPPGARGPACRLPESVGNVENGQDTTPPTLTARVKRRQRVLRLRGVVARVGCDEACSVAARGRLRIGRARYRMRGVRSAQVGAAQAQGRVRLKVRLTKRGRRALRRCARRGRLRRASVRVTLRATDGAGLRSRPVSRVVRVRR